MAPDSCTEDEAVCLSDMQRCIGEFHDNSRREHAAVKLNTVPYVTTMLQSCNPALLHVHSFCSVDEHA